MSGIYYYRVFFIAKYLSGKLISSLKVSSLKKDESFYFKFVLILFDPWLEESFKYDTYTGRYTLIRVYSDLAISF